MIDIVMIMGFLGSGKTTLMERILESADERVGFIVNEFSAVSVDGERLSARGGMEIVEVNAGSIFCACKMDFFVEAVLIMAQKGIQKIYVEASGLANPSGIEKILADLNALKKTEDTYRIASCVCVADAERIGVLVQVSTAVVSQIQRAQVVLLNKADLVDQSVRQQAEESIRSVNPRVAVIPCVRCAVDLSGLSDSRTERQERDCVSAEPIKERSFTLIDSQTVSREALDAFLNAAIPFSVRIKGWLKVDGKNHYIDVVPPHIVIEPDAAKHTGKLVVIVTEDEKQTAKEKIEFLWHKAFRRLPEQIVV